MSFISAALGAMGLSLLGAGLASLAGSPVCGALLALFCCLLVATVWLGLSYGFELLLGPVGSNGVKEEHAMAGAVGLGANWALVDEGCADWLDGAYAEACERSRKTRALVEADADRWLAGADRWLTEAA